MNAFKLSEIKDLKREVKIFSMRKIGKKNYLFTDLCIIEYEKNTLLNYNAQLDEISGVYTLLNNKNEKVKMPITCKLSELQ